MSYIMKLWRIFTLLILTSFIGYGEEIDRNQLRLTDYQLKEETEISEIEKPYKSGEIDEKWST